MSRRGETASLAVVSAGISSPSSTRLLADRVSHSVVDRLAEEGIVARPTVIELASLATDITSALLTGFTSDRLQAALDALTTSDGAIMVSPIFTTSYSGLFKSFVDIIEVGTLTDLPILIAATGGTERHSLALDYGMRPLFVYHHAIVSTTGVYAATADWGTTASAGGRALSERIGRAAVEFAGLVARSERDARIPDPFALPAGFSPSGTLTTS